MSENQNLPSPSAYGLTWGEVDLTTQGMSLEQALHHLERKFHIWDRATSEAWMKRVFQLREQAGRRRNGLARKSDGPTGVGAQRSSDRLPR